MNENRKIGIKLYAFLAILLILSSLITFSFSMYFGPSFVMKYSIDNSLKESTLEKINLIKKIFLIFSFFPIVLFLISLLFYNNIISFLEKKKRIIVNLLLLCAVFIFIIAITEFFSWFILNDETSFSSTGPAYIKFVKENVKLNNVGFRDYNFSIEKNDSVKRIAVVGDSLSFGSGIKDFRDTYPKLLEKYLNNLNYSDKYEVYNFGIPGYDALDELNIIKNKVLDYNPNIIIIEYYENDIENNDPELKNFESVDNLEIPFVGFWLRDISYSYYFFESRLNKALENFGLKRKWLDTLNKTYSSQKNTNYTLGIYGQISNITKERNITVVFVAFPVVSDFKDYKFYFVHSFAKRISIGYNFYFIDLQSSFAKFDHKDLSVNDYDYHPNELGHKIAAQELFNYLSNSSLSPPDYSVNNSSKKNISADLYNAHLFQM